MSFWSFNISFSESLLFGMARIKIKSQTEFAFVFQMDLGGFVQKLSQASSIIEELSQQIETLQFHGSFDDVTQDIPLKSKAQLANSLSYLASSTYLCIPLHSMS